MLKTNKVLLLLVIATSFQAGRAQNKMPINGFEVYSGLGIAYFSGDLGGAGFSPASLKPVVSGGLRYYFTNRVAVRVNVSYGKLAADDSLSSNLYSKQRNLNFKSDILDAALQIEYSLLNWNVRGQSKKLVTTHINRRHNLYVFTGISVFHFKPYGKLNGQWYSLQELSTAGQGLPNGAKPYSLYAISIPIGSGYKVLVNKTVSIGVEVTFRKTFTDYIDDVSAPYYDNTLLRQAKGNIAADIADKNKFRDGAKRRAGEGRGNPNSNDNFAFLQITFNKRLNLYSGRRDLPCTIFSK